MKTRLILIGLALLLTAGVAQAHNFTIHYTHLAKLHAPGTAQGQEVVKAVVRVGILAIQAPLPDHPFMPGPYQPPFWAAEQKITLTKKGNHFFGKVKINVTEYPGGPRMGSLMEQTTLFLANGETLVLRDTSVKTTDQRNTSSPNDYHEALAELMEAYNGTTDSNETSQTTVSLFQKGFPY